MGIRNTVVPLLLALVAGACSSKPEPPPPAKEAPTYTLRKITLPDLARAAPSVQQQLRDMYTSLQMKVDAPNTPTDQLALAYGQMGMLLMAAEYRDEAEAALLDAQTFNPRDPRWPYYLAHLYKTKGDAPKSAAAFTRALELKPDDVPTLVWLGDARLDEGKPDQAEPLFAKAAALQPTSVAAQYGVGRAALAKQDYTGAVSSLEKALALDPRATIIHYPLGMAYRGAGDQAKAQAHLAQRGTLAIEPDDPLRSKRRRRARPRRLEGRGRQFPEGHRSGPEGSVTPPQAWYGARAAGRRPRRHRRVRACDRAGSDLCEGSLQPRPDSRRDGSDACRDPAFPGGTEVPAGLRRSTPAARPHASSERPAGSVAAALRADRQGGRTGAGGAVRLCGGADSPETLQRGPRLPRRGHHDLPQRALLRECRSASAFGRARRQSPRRP